MASWPTLRTEPVRKRVRRLNVVPPARIVSTRASRLHAFHGVAGGGGRPHRRKEKAMTHSALKRIAALMMLALFSSSVLTACNTMAGVGKDVEKAGDKIENKAEDCKDAEC
jgi:entericidin A